MDKKAWFAITFSVIGLVLWNIYVLKYQRLPEPAAAAPSPSAAAPASPAPGAPSLGAPDSAASREQKPSVPPTPVVAERFETISLPEMIIRFTNLGGGIADITLLGHQHLVADGRQIELNAKGQLPIGSLGVHAGDVEEARQPYEMRRDGETVTFERVTAENIKITKKFTIQPKKGIIPALSLEVTYANVGSAPVAVPAYYLYAGSAAPIHPRDQPAYTECAWMHDGKVDSKGVSYFEPGRIPLVGIETHPAPTVFEQTVDKVAWLGVKNQFYTTIIAVTPPPAAAGQTPDLPSRTLWAERFDVPPDADQPAGGRHMYGIDAALSLASSEIPAGSSQSQTFQIYAGPTQYDRLTQLGQAEDEILKYGWFAPVSIFLLNSLNWLKSILGNYGWAIIVLTLCIKLVLYPLQAKANRSAKLMAALAPKMNELREKYKDDPTRQQSETLKLYKDYGVNPLGGCLPMLIQLPIFLGFFRMLGTAAELRNSGFLWVRDLSQPDTVAHYMGYSLNILPLVMAGTMLWQMSLTPKTGDANQRRIMMIAPLMFVLFCYSFASALSLYYTMQNLLTIVQLYLTRNQGVPTLVKRTGKDSGGRGPGAGAIGSSGKKKPKQAAPL